MGASSEMWMNHLDLSKILEPLRVSNNTTGTIDDPFSFDQSITEPDVTPDKERTKRDEG
jgi:hypothetical protein